MRSKLLYWVEDSLVATTLSYYVRMYRPNKIEIDVPKIQSIDFWKSYILLEVKSDFDNKYYKTTWSPKTVLNKIMTWNK